jgi:hypothetical protein
LSSNFLQKFSKAFIWGLTRHQRVAFKKTSTIKEEKHLTELTATLIIQSKYPVLFSGPTDAKASILSNP